MKLLIILSFFISLQSRASKDSPLTSTVLTPKFSADYYADQSNKYFDTLDSYASRKSKPKYSKNVIRWEWYPWLKLTGFKKLFMNFDYFLTWYPTKVVNRECRGFDVQPFGRCHVRFEYKNPKHNVDIYEEFTFNDQGEITFIEAWTDEPGFWPMSDPNDYWAEGIVNRLSTRVPGLGSSNGLVRLRNPHLKKLAKSDPEVKDLFKRLRNPAYWWTVELFRFMKKKD